MHKLIPLTMLMTLTSTLVYTSLWLYVTRRNRNKNITGQTSVKYLTNYFGYLAIFVAIMTVPYFWLPVSPAAFSTAMAWGYVVGHIFCYIGFMCVALMVCSLVPRLNNKIGIVATLFLVADVVATVINAKTMIWGIKPYYNAANNLTYLQPSTAVGIAIAVTSLASMLPAAILFILSAVRDSGPRRVKSALLASGFILVMIGGPMNDNSHTAVMYTLAVVITITGVLIVGAGVGYQIETGLAEAKIRGLPKLSPSSTT
jgi:hypothetical protein